MISDAPDRIVIDTNSLVSAYLFPHSIPGQVLDVVLAKHRLLMSIEVATELTDVMRREKFDRFLSRRRREELVAGTIRESEFVETSSDITACRDAADNKFLELAVDGQASTMVTGDTDLLALHPFRGIQILTARDFLAQYATE